MKRMFPLKLVGFCWNRAGHRATRCPGFSTETPRIALCTEEEQSKTGLGTVGKWEGGVGKVHKRLNRTDAEMKFQQMPRASPGAECGFSEYARLAT